MLGNVDLPTGMEIILTSHAYKCGGLLIVCPAGSQEGTKCSDNFSFNRAVMCMITTKYSVGLKTFTK